MGRPTEGKVESTVFVKLYVVIYQRLCGIIPYGICILYIFMGYFQRGSTIEEKNQIQEFGKANQHSHHHFVQILVL